MCQKQVQMGETCKRETSVKKVAERVSAKSLQSCLTLCDPVDCSPPGSSVHGILQARILGRVAISLSRGSSLPREGRDQSRVSYISFIGRWVDWAAVIPAVSEPQLFRRECFLSLSSPPAGCKASGSDKTLRTVDCQDGRSLVSWFITS